MGQKQIGVMQDGVFTPLTNASVEWNRELGETLNLRVTVARYDLDFARDPVGVIEAVLHNARRDLMTAAMRRPGALV